MVTTAPAPHARLAVYTAVYPAARQYLAAWYRSVLDQTDPDFDLWVSLDGLDRTDVKRAVGEELVGEWLAAPASATIADVRQHALTELVKLYDAVVFVDADDRLHPSRVAAARAALKEHDVAACALRVIDGSGCPVGVTFGPSEAIAADALLPQWNVFGLSNTAYRSAVLHDVLPIPTGARLVDWLLATRAWASGAVLGFDREARMDYRQGDRNVARILPPFTAERVKGDTAMVLAHYEVLLGSAWPMPGWCADVITTARARAHVFQDRIVSSDPRLAAYVDALNRLEPEYVWWWSVANPALEAMWSN